MLFTDWAETVNAARKHSKGARRKILLTNSGSRFTRVLNSLSLRILWRRWWLGCIGILMGFVSLQRSLRVLRLRILEPLECAHGLLRVFDAMKVTVDDSELIPSLLDDFGIGAGRGRGTLQELRSGSVVAEEHFRTGPIVIGMKKSGLCLQCGFHELLALRAVSFFNGQHPELVSSQGVERIDFQLT